ncbi:MAG TPA: hypothetical protein VGB55_14665 [Tepidisphaeraceae bacterium]|jgi:predicted peptidase
MSKDGVPQPGVQVEQSEGGDGVRYLLHLPKNYTDKKKWPVLMFLHGMGERGSVLQTITANGPPKILMADSPEAPVMSLMEDFIVVSPQCPDTGVWFHFEKQVLAITDAVSARFNGDADKTYLTGLSMGGYATWRMASQMSNKWAAILPVCGGLAPMFGFSLDAVGSISPTLPIWTHHGDEDNVVPYADTVTIVDHLEQAGPKFRREAFAPRPKDFLSEPRIFTTHVGVGHDSWTPTYNDPEIYRWLLHWSR